MDFKLNFSKVKNDLAKSFDQFSTSAKKWMGRMVTQFQESGNKLAPYMQNPFVALVSLVALNIFLFEVGKTVAENIDDYAKRNEYTHIEQIFLAALFSPAIFGVIAFTHYTKLPFNAYKIAGISMATLMITDRLNSSR